MSSLNAAGWRKQDHVGQGLGDRSGAQELTLPKAATIPAPNHAVVAVRAFLSNFSLDHAVAGVGAALTTTICMHPLDLVKTRLQVQHAYATGKPRYTGTFNALATIFKTEGFSGLYQGLAPNMAGNVAAWGLYFMGYNIVKAKIKQYRDGAPLGPQHHMTAALLTGLTTQLLTNPLWVVKTRMCYQGPYADGCTVIYHSMGDAMRSIWRSEGVSGFYKGWIPGLLGVSHSAVQFVVYEELKARTAPGSDSGHTSVQYLTMASISKAIATLATYPVQPLKSRLQAQRPGQEVYRGLLHCLYTVWRKEGPVGFYRGLGSNLLRVIPATCITFTVYEHLSRTIQEAYNIT